MRRSCSGWWRWCAVNQSSWLPLSHSWSLTSKTEPTKTAKLLQWESPECDIQGCFILLLSIHDDFTKCPKIPSQSEHILMSTILYLLGKFDFVKAKHEARTLCRCVFLRERIMQARAGEEAQQKDGFSWSPASLWSHEELWSMNDTKRLFMPLRGKEMIFLYHSISQGYYESH